VTTLRIVSSGQERVECSGCGFLGPAGDGAEGAVCEALLNGWMFLGDRYGRSEGIIALCADCAAAAAGSEAGAAGADGGDDAGPDDRRGA
jgi:hypothetical protein